VCETDRAGNVRIDHVVDVREVLIQERSSQTMTGVGEQRGNRSLADRIAQAIDSGRGRQIILDRLDLRAEARELGTSLLQRGVGGDDQIEPTLRGFDCELATDPARCTRDDGKRLGRGRWILSGHVQSPLIPSLLRCTRSPRFLALLIVRCQSLVVVAGLPA
jgi:hypothetical protein